jgi:hypothetical protein
MTAAWHPRGEPSWPDWKQAEPGARFYVAPQIEDA